MEEAGGSPPRQAEAAAHSDAAVDCDTGLFASGKRSAIMPLNGSVGFHLLLHQRCRRSESRDLRSATGPLRSSRRAGPPAPGEPEKALQPDNRPRGSIVGRMQVPMVFGVAERPPLRSDRPDWQPMGRADATSCRAEHAASGGGNGFHTRKTAATQSKQARKGMARPKGFEPLTPRFVVWCSIQLSYGRIPNCSSLGPIQVALARP